MKTLIPFQDFKKHLATSCTHLYDDLEGGGVQQQEQLKGNALQQATRILKAKDMDDVIGALEGIGIGSDEAYEFMIDCLVEKVD
jgi:hypothetical protein